MNDPVEEYAKLSGAAQVWKAWRDKMIDQGREVKAEYMDWPIPQKDIELDASIAYLVVDDFLTWAQAHRGLCFSFVVASTSEERG